MDLINSKYLLVGLTSGSVQKESEIYSLPIYPTEIKKKKNPK